MTSKNQVTLTFAGDSRNLEKSFDRVGGSARSMGDDVDRAGDRFNRIGEGADTMDTRAMGFRDTVTGIQDSFQAFNKEGASMQERILLLGMGFGDLASGIANFGVQFFQQVGRFIANSARMVAAHTVNVAKMVAGWVVMGLQATLNAVKMAAAWLISLGPIGLVIAAVGAVIGILVALGVGFDDIKRFAKAAWDFILGAIRGVFNWVKENWPLILAIITGPIGLAVLAIVRNKDRIIGAFRAAFDWVRNAASGVKDWIVARFNDVVSFFQGIPGRITSAFSSLGSGVAEAFKSAWNSTLGGLVIFPGFDPPGPGSLPRITIPELAQGGIVTSPTLALIGEDGPEAVVPLGGRRGGAASTVVHVHVNVAGSIVSERDIVAIVRNALNLGGMRGAIR